jgi:hypothetical protein
MNRRQDEEMEKDRMRRFCVQQQATTRYQWYSWCGLHFLCGNLRAVCEWMPGLQATRCFRVNRNQQTRHLCPGIADALKGDGTIAAHIRRSSATQILDALAFYPVSSGKLVRIFSRIVSNTFICERSYCVWLQNTKRIIGDLTYYHFWLRDTVCSEEVLAVMGMKECSYSTNRLPVLT